MNIKPTHRGPALIVAAATLASTGLFAGASAGQTPGTIVSLALILVVGIPAFTALLAFNWTPGR